MSFRAIALGLVGAVFIATVGYFVGHVCRLNRFVCGQFPIIVYAPLVLVVLVNPVLGRLRRRWCLRPAELVVIIVAALAACSIPSNGLLRYFTRAIVMPLQLNEESAGWERYEVLKAVPSAMLVNDAKYDESLLKGFMEPFGEKGEWIGIRKVPWGRWSGTLMFWGSVVLLFGVASVCLALIVHPQWSRRERLRYPIAVFANTMLGADEPGQSVPIYRRRLFWLGLVIMLCYHVNNGLGTWFPGSLVHIPLRYDFSAIGRKYTWLSHGWGGMTIGRPMI
ncbi:MAG: DUF6785 family protein, partial [Planctomycetota bacterium]